MTTLDCLNQDVLDVIRSLQDEDDPHMLDEIIHMYLETSEELMDTLVQASKHADDLDDVRIAAHTLKGSSANVGAQRVAEACFNVESIARTGNVDGLEPALANLQQEFAHACQALKAELSNNAA